MGTSVLRNQMTALGDFISEEIRKRNLSAAQFAKQIGVDPSTISKATRFEGAPDPSLEFLVKLSNGTGTSLITLLKLSFPDLKQVDVDPEARMLAELIAQLPPDKREIAESFIVGTLMKSRNE